MTKQKIEHIWQENAFLNK